MRWLSMSDSEGIYIHIGKELMDFAKSRGVDLDKICTQAATKELRAHIDALKQEQDTRYGKEVVKRFKMER
jgi:hypothetical protein